MATWTGADMAKPTDFSTADNWDIGAVPLDAGTTHYDVVFDSAGNTTVALSRPIVPSIPAFGKSSSLTVVQGQVKMVPATTSGAYGIASTTTIGTVAKKAATLELDNVDLHTSDLVLAAAQASSGELLLDSVATVVHAKATVVGEEGQGSIKISNGARMFSTSLTIGGVGFSQSASGKVVVDGNGGQGNKRPSEVVAGGIDDGTLVVGGGGPGSLIISNGAEGRVHGSLLIGNSMPGLVGLTNSAYLSVYRVSDADTFEIGGLAPAYLTVADSEVKTDEVH